MTTTTSGWHRKRVTPAEQQRRRDYAAPTYRRERAAAQRLVDSGNAGCWRCRRLIPPGSAWHLGHDDHDRHLIRGPEHAACNLRAAASKGARTVNARHRRRLPGW